MNKNDGIRGWFSGKSIDFLIAFFICFMAPMFWINVNMTGMPHWVYQHELFIWFRYNWLKWLLYWFSVSLIGLPLLRFLISRLYNTNKVIAACHIRVLNDSNASEEEKLKAIDALSENMTFGAVPRIIKSTRDRNESIQKGALEALNKVKFTQALKWLIAPVLVLALLFMAVNVISSLYHRGSTVEALFDARFTLNPDEDTKWEAAIALGKLKNRFAVRPLLEILTHKEEPVKEEKTMDEVTVTNEDKTTKEVTVTKEKTVTTTKNELEKRESIKKYQDEAIKTLLGMGSSAYDPLLKIMNDKYDELRAAAATALGDMGNADILKHLRNVLDDKRNPEGVRSAAAKAIGKIEKRRSENIINVLKAFFTGDPEKAMTAIIGTFDRIDIKIVENNYKKVNNTIEVIPVWSIKYYINQAVERARVRKTYDTHSLLEILSSKNENNKVREDATLALGKLCDPRSIKSIIEVLKDKDIGLRQSAANALGDIGSPRTLKPLIKAFKDKNEDEYVRGYAAYGLSSIGSSRVLELLIETLKDKDVDQYVREAAAAALGDIGSPRTLTPLIETLKDKNEDKYVREAAAKALGKIGDTRAVEPLIETWKDKDENKEVRMVAGFALARSGSPRALMPLIETLRDKSEDKYLREAATYALDFTSDPRAVKPLILTLNDKNENVRSGATKALEKITGKHFGDDRAILHKWWKENRKEYMKYNIP